MVIDEQRQWGRDWIEVQIRSAARVRGLQIEDIEWLSTHRREPHGNITGVETLIITCLGWRVIKDIDLATLEDLGSSAVMRSQMQQDLRAWLSSPKDDRPSDT